MIIKADAIKSICSKIAPALDASSFSVLTEILQLTVENKQFKLAVTNKEYYVKGTFRVDTEESFNATVKADLFIKLIEHITTDTISFEIDNTSLIIKGNGQYKLPLIYDGESLMKVPEIKIENVTTEFALSSDILRSINTYNSKELSKGTIFKPVQNMYYIDNMGAITFTSGACVNSFTLEKPISMLLNAKLVKLFNLFEPGIGVNFAFGCDTISKKLVQNKVRFCTDNFEITAIISNDDSLIATVPVSAIRSRTSAEYPYSMILNRSAILQAIDRLSLFIMYEKSAPCIVLKVFKDYVILSDVNNENTEKVPLINASSGVDDSYTFMLDLNDFRITLTSYIGLTGQDISIHFGDKQAVLIPNGNIKIIIPEFILN